MSTPSLETARLSTLRDKNIAQEHKEESFIEKVGRKLKGKKK